MHAAAQAPTARTGASDKARHGTAVANRVATVGFQNRTAVERHKRIPYLHHPTFRPASGTLSSGLGIDACARLCRPPKDILSGHLPADARPSHLSTLHFHGEARAHAHTSSCTHAHRRTHLQALTRTHIPHGRTSPRTYARAPARTRTGENAHAHTRPACPRRSVPRACARAVCALLLMHRSLTTTQVNWEGLSLQRSTPPKMSVLAARLKAEQVTCVCTCVSVSVRACLYM
jgi:hypothetical protein